MSIIDVTTSIAEDTMIELGRTAERLIRMPFSAINNIAIADMEGSPLTGYAALKDLSLKLDLLAEAVADFDLRQRYSA